VIKAGICPICGNKLEYIKLGKVEETANGRIKPTSKYGYAKCPKCDYTEE